MINPYANKTPAELMQMGREQYGEYRCDGCDMRREHAADYCPSCEEWTGSYTMPVDPGFVPGGDLAFRRAAYHGWPL